MESGKELAKRLSDVFVDGKWIAFTNYKQLLDNITWEEAQQKIENLNTIKALTFHIHYYLHGVLHVFNGGELTIRDKFSYEHQGIDSAQKWDALRRSLQEDARSFAQHVAAMDEDTLNSFFVKEDYGSYRRNIEAMIEHAYYHMGQVAMLKKAIKGSIS